MVSASKNSSVEWDRVSIIAGGGVRADHVKELVARTGVKEVHARGTEAGTIAGIVRALGT